MQTQIRLLLKEQSNQGLHCLPFQLRHRCANSNPISYKAPEAFGEQTLVKMIQSCHQYIRLDQYTLLYLEEDKGLFLHLKAWMGQGALMTLNVANI